MRQRPEFVPTVADRLEERVALSHAGAVLAHVQHLAATAPHAIVLNLVGTVKGTAIPSPLASALPGDLLLTGSGRVAPLGRVSLVGTLSIQSGEPTFFDGTVNLTNARGGIQVHIFGIQGGPSGPPAHLQYQIIAGWGAYLGATGKGDVVYAQGLPGAGSTPFALTFGPTATATA